MVESLRLNWIKKIFAYVELQVGIVREIVVLMKEVIIDNILKKNGEGIGNFVIDIQQ